MYYSLLWTEPSAKTRFLERLNLIQALNTALDDVQDPQVAEQKIHWWHEELQRMLEGNARHPATQACQASLCSLKVISEPQHNRVLTLCLQILSSASTVRFTPPSTDADVEQTLIKSYTGRLSLLSHALSQQVSDIDPDTHPVMAALALGKHEQLIRLPFLLHRGQPVFSAETYRQYAVNAADLAAQMRASQKQDDVFSSNESSLVDIPIMEDKPGRSQLLTHVIDDAHNTLQRVTKNKDIANRYRRAPLLPIWRLLVLREKQLALWRRKQPDLLRQRSTLTPLVKFFIAWRNRR